MIPNNYILEQLMYQRRQTLLREAEQERRLAEMQPAAAPHRMHRLVARFGGYLISVGTRLQHAQAVE
jgi:hypothetical protein